MSGPDLVASVRQRLRNLAHERGEDFNLVLTRFANQRFLRRLAASAERDRLVLKGATLFAVWSDQPHRPTRDVDLLGHGDNEPPAVAETIRAICATNVEPDALVFDDATIRAGVIRDDQEYEGVRVTLTVRLGNARIPLQIDVGFGDAVYPEPEDVEVEGMIGFPGARVRAYPREAVIAEKLQAMVALGIANSRMKDFHDIWTLAREFRFEGPTLVEAIRRTFRRRRTPIPSVAPIALTHEFAGDPSKANQWVGFIQKAGLRDALGLGDVVEQVAALVGPALVAARAEGPFELVWVAPGPWQKRSSEA